MGTNCKEERPCAGLQKNREKIFVFSIYLFLFTRASYHLFFMLRFIIYFMSLVISPVLFV